MRLAAFLLLVPANAASLVGCDRDRARSEPFTIIDAGRMASVESTPYDTLAEPASPQTAGEVTVIGGAGDPDANVERGTTTLTSGEQSTESKDRSITQKRAASDHAGHDDVSPREEREHRD